MALSNMVLYTLATILLQNNEYVITNLKSAKVGEHIYFVKYEQDNDVSNGKEIIKWTVLRVTDGKALVISEYVLDQQTFNGNKDEVTWENCGLRRWLNDDFIHIAFGETEQSKILTSSVLNDNGSTIEDRIFLLNFNDISTYFYSKSDRYAIPTKYAIFRGATEPYCSWWLRSSGEKSGTAVYVDNNGVLPGSKSANNPLGIRPAMWIDISD